VFALDWESHKSLKHDRECLTELLERECFQPHAIQRIQLAEVGWISDDKCWVRLTSSTWIILKVWKTKKTSTIFRSSQETDPEVCLECGKEDWSITNNFTERTKVQEDKAGTKQQLRTLSLYGDCIVYMDYCVYVLQTFILSHTQGERNQKDYRNHSH